MIGCREWREDVSAWIDRALPPQRSAQVAAHLKACQSCRAWRRSVEQLGSLTRAERRLTASDRVTRAAMALVRQHNVRPRGDTERWSRRLLPFWPKFSVAASGLAVAGVLALVLSHNDLTHILSPGSGVGASAPSGDPSPTVRAAQATAPGDESALATAGGKLILNSPADGVAAIRSLAVSLGGAAQTVAAPGGSTVIASVPAAAKADFEAGLQRLGRWQQTRPGPTRPESSSFAIEIVPRP